MLSSGLRCPWAGRVHYAWAIARPHRFGTRTTNIFPPTQPPIHTSPHMQKTYTCRHTHTYTHTHTHTIHSASILFPIYPSFSLSLSLSLSPPPLLSVSLLAGTWVLILKLIDYLRYTRDSLAPPPTHPPTHNTHTLHPHPPAIILVFCLPPPILSPPSFTMAHSVNSDESRVGCGEHIKQPVSQ